MKKIRSDQAAFRFVQWRMRLQHLFHVRGALLEDLEQIFVPAFEVFEHFRELLCRHLGIEP
jgi:hypothetical protein